MKAPAIADAMLAAKPSRSARAKAARQRRQKLSRTIIALAESAYFWYVLLAASGALMMSVGVCLRYGLGAALVVLGVMAVAGSEIIRRGMTRA